MLRKFKRKKYDMFLRDEDKVKNCKPALVKNLYKDIDLELYTADSGYGENTWCIAVVAIEKRFSIFRTKYDSAKMDRDLESMADRCKNYIKIMWGEKHFRDLANKN